MYNGEHFNKTLESYLKNNISKRYCQRKGKIVYKVKVIVMVQNFTFTIKSGSRLV